jgi:hypothetical protein
VRDSNQQQILKDHLQKDFERQLKDLNQKIEQHRQLTDKLTEQMGQLDL